jgi:hypothetical protein
MHPKALETRVKAPMNEGLEVIKPRESKQRQSTSHKKYDFLVYSFIMMFFF